MKPFCSTSVFALMAAALTSLTTPAATETYVIDPVHSSVEFRIRHFFSKVAGAFTKFNGTIQVDREHMEHNRVEAVIDVSSVDTHVARRDDDLRSKNFFEAAKYPKMTFVSKRWRKTAPDTFEVTGDLTLRGVAKATVLAVKSLGFGSGLRGMAISGWEARTTLHKSDFGMTYGGQMLGDEVEVIINIEADRK